MMLIFEAVSLLFILVLGIAIWVHKGFAVDMDQVTLHATTPGGVISGIVLVVFAFSGFESSTSLGTEAPKTFCDQFRDAEHGDLGRFFPLYGLCDHPLF
jgi:amino acid transporter